TNPLTPMAGIPIIRNLEKKQKAQELLANFSSDIYKSTSDFVQNHLCFFSQYNSRGKALG
ncbi:hypothetical protein ACQ1PX_05735, partial [Ornithobacterium rhinotracheale]